MWILFGSIYRICCDCIIFHGDLFIETKNALGKFLQQILHVVKYTVHRLLCASWSETNKILWFLSYFALLPTTEKI